MRRLASFFGVAYFIQGFADISLALTRQQVQYLLKRATPALHCRLSSLLGNRKRAWGGAETPLLLCLSDSVPFPLAIVVKVTSVLMALVGAPRLAAATHFSSSYTTFIVCSPSVSSITGFQHLTS